MTTTNPLPEDFSEIDSLRTPLEYSNALAMLEQGTKLITHTPHSCRASVVSEWIKLLPPDIIGAHITGHSTAAHVIYYAKVDPDYLHRHRSYQNLALGSNIDWDKSSIANIKTEDINSKLQQAFRADRSNSAVDFGAISFDRESQSGETLTGIKTLQSQPLEALSFQSTHICPYGNSCPEEIIKDLGARPGESLPCGSCYYSIKTVDHLPRILGHIRALTDECAELDTYLVDARKHGASSVSLTPKANYRKFLAQEITSWSVTAHCLEQMYSDLKSRSNFLIQKPEIVTAQLERVESVDFSLANLIARSAEAKTHAEFFTPQLNRQLVAARHRLLAFTGDINKLIQETPNGYSLIDEFRGLIRTTCEALNLSPHELASAMTKPMPTNRSQISGSMLNLISQSGVTARG